MYDDLISLAEKIATLEKLRPKQAHLRRAVSTAYYAVFHLLVDQACRLQMGSSKSQIAYRHSLGRAFVHTVMKDACRSFGSRTLPERVVKGLPRQPTKNYVVPESIKKTARLFVDLQEKRHLADYDLREQFKLSEVLKLIESTKRQVESFRSLQESDDRKIFLACLLAWKDMKNR